MKNFWPHRPHSKGFSIEKLARKYREKISSNSLNDNSAKLINNKNLDSAYEENKNIKIASLPFKVAQGHWANRDFSEYRKVA